MKSIFFCSLNAGPVVHSGDKTRVEAASAKKAAEIYSAMVERPIADGDTYNVSVWAEEAPFVHRVFAVTLKVVPVRTARELT